MAFGDVYRENAAKFAEDSGAPELANIIRDNPNEAPAPEEILYDGSANPPSIFNPSYDVNQNIPQQEEPIIKEPVLPVLTLPTLSSITGYDSSKDPIYQNMMSGLPDESSPLHPKNNSFSNLVSRSQDIAANDPTYRSMMSGLPNENSFNPVDAVNRFNDVVSKAQDIAANDPTYRNMVSGLPDENSVGFNDFVLRYQDIINNDPTYKNIMSELPDSYSQLNSKNIKSGSNEFNDMVSKAQDIAANDPIYRNMVNGLPYENSFNPVDAANRFNDVVSRSQDIANNDPIYRNMVSGLPYENSFNPVDAANRFNDVVSKAQDITANDPTYKNMISGLPDKNSILHPDNLSILTSSENRDKWNEYFNKKGGLESNYNVGSNDIGDALIDSALFSRSLDANVLPDSSIDPYSKFSKGLDKMANENYDDGTMRADSVKSLNMKGSEYKEYVKEGFGGRPIEDIDDDLTYNKLNEMRNYGFKPYVEDTSQVANWMAQQAGNDTSAFYNTFNRARELTTDAKINFNDQKISREDLYDNVQNYFKGEDESNYFSHINNLFNNGELPMVDANDPSVDPNSDMGGVVVWSFPELGYEITSNDQPNFQWSNDGSTLTVWWDGYEDKAIDFDGLDDYYEHMASPKMHIAEDGDPVHFYWKVPRLSYKQSDGTNVDLSYKDVEDIFSSLNQGTADMDWGPLNIAKDSNDRKDFDQMISTMDFSDLVPNMVDLTLGSAPLFSNYTAWPMAGANAITASQGLDPRLYDIKNDTWRRLSDDMNGDKYLANIVLSGLVPATERMAGVIGGSGGVIGSPIQKLMGKYGAPALMRYGFDVLGEGIEENVASAWEDYQTNGWKNWFANPVYKTDPNTGETLMQYDSRTGQMEPVIDYDTTGHERRDPNTPWNERVGNWWDQQFNNTAAGVALGLPFGAHRAISDARYGTGYFGEALDNKALRNFERENNLPRFRKAKQGNKEFRITPEDFGTYYDETR